MRRHASLNLAYRLVWDCLKQMWIPVAETSRRHRKSGAVTLLAAGILSLGSGGALALPAGGQVSAGSGQISQSGAQLSVTQSSQNLAINWQDFSIAANESVTFNQPNAAAIALNRVLGQNGSEILGHLQANGQVFLINPNGVLFGSSAQVSVGGLVATTLQLGDPDFLAGNYRFAGTSTAAVSNAGSITAGSGGYVALMAANVVNAGQVVAPGGSVSLAAGQQVTLTLDNGSLLGLTVDQGAVNALAANHGLLQANGGQVLLTAEAADQLTRAVVNNDGVIEAQTVANQGGTIRLLGDMTSGSVTVAGTLDASAPAGGNGGFIETSAAQVKVADATVVTTKSATGTNGSWLIDPADFTIAATGGDISGATLGASLANGNVLLESSSGTVNASGSGSINVNDAVSWSANTLTLTAADNININAVMTAGGTAGLALNPATANGADAAVSGGTVIVGLSGSGFRGRVDFTGTGNSLSINGVPYTIISALGAQGDTGGTTLQGIAGALSGHYVLGNDIDASSTSGWNSGQGFTPIGSSGAPFTGVFDGLGHTISGLSEQSGGNYIGLFGYTSGGALRNVGLTSVSIGGASIVGGLAGFSGSTLSNDYVTGTVTGSGGSVGGLVGSNGGPITAAFVSGSTVSGGSSSFVGGLVGNNSGPISQSYVLNSTVTGASDVGGLVGQNTGSLQEVYTAGGLVSGTSVVGGLVGQNNGSVVDAYSTSPVSGSSATGGLIGQEGSSYIYAVPYSYWVSTGCDRYGCYGYWATGYNYYTGYNSGYVNSSFSASDLTGQAGVIGSFVSGTTSATSTTSSVMMSATTFAGAGWSIATTPGSNSVWRIYEGSTQPLLRTFLTPLTITPTQSLVYDAAVQGNSGALSYSLTPDLAQIMGTPVYSGTGLNAGNYALTVSGLYSGQSGYDISYAVGTLNISPATLTLTASTNTKVFDGNTTAAATVGVSGLQGADSVTGLTESYSSKNVSGINGSTLNVDGGYVVNDGNGGANYTVVTNTAAGTITPATLTLSATTNTKVYDGNTSASGAVNVSGLIGGDTVSGVTESYASKNVLGTNGSTLSVDAGYTVNDGNGGANYSIVTNTAAGTITPATLTLSAATNTKVYDGTTSAAAAVGISGLQGTDGVTGLTESYGSKNVLGTNGSTLSVDAGYTVNDGNGGANYSIVTNTAAGTITPATLTLSAATNTKVYDGTTSATAAVGISGLQGTDGVTGLTESYGSKNVLGTNGSTLSVDAGYTVNDGNGGANYSIVTNTAAGTITPATLTLSAATNTKVYDGTTSAAAAVGISGLQGTDGVTGLTESYGSKNVLGTNGSTLSVDAGYTVNDGNAGANYSIVTNTAAGTITPATLTLSAATNTKVYDGTTSATAAVGISGLQGTDGVTGLTESYGSKNVLGTNGSTLNVNGGYTVSDGNGGANYSIVTNTAAGTITPATLTLSAATNTKVYDGTTSATAAVGISGLQGTDGVTGLTESYGSKNVLGTNGSTLSVNGGYTVSDGNGGANYSIVTNTAAGTITPAPLSIAVIDTTKPLGALLPTFGATMTGFVPGEGASNLTGVLQFQTPATKSSPAGTYVVTPAGVSDANYAITFVNGTLTIQSVPAQGTAARVLASTRNPSHDKAGGFLDESGSDELGAPHVIIRNGGLHLPSDMGNQDGM